MNNKFFSGTYSPAGSPDQEPLRIPGEAPRYVVAEATNMMGPLYNAVRLVDSSDIEHGAQKPPLHFIPPQAGVEYYNDQQAA